MSSVQVWVTTRPGGLVEGQEGRGCKIFIRSQQSRERVHQALERSRLVSLIGRQPQLYS